MILPSQKYREYISIHAPREGGDGDQGRRRCAVLNFNPRPPRGGRLRSPKERKVKENISIHAPREEGDYDNRKMAMTNDISIHAPREGGDYDSSSRYVTFGLFQSTPPARGATACLRYFFTVSGISIHAPARGATALLCVGKHGHQHFNPRPREGGDDFAGGAGV